MNALQRFGERDFAEGIPPPSAFTLTSEPVAEACLTGSQPGIPCKPAPNIDQEIARP